MLYGNSGVGPRLTSDEGEHRIGELTDAIWLDLVKPTEHERSLAERATGLRVPPEADLAEIESSSRLSSEDGVLYLSAPMSYLDGHGVPHSAPLGFVLSKDRLITIRFVDLPVFDSFAERFAAHGAAPGSATVFLGLLEALVDRLADVLEHLGRDLETISHRVFRPEPAKRENGSRIDAQLRGTLRTVGRSGERLSTLRDSLLGVQRIVQYAGEAAAGFIAEAERPRLVTLRQDIASLMDYDVQLSNKVQFLLDATLGFINIEQNNGIKILTVVSVVGVPPTLIASIYGMNFKWIPELQWEYGYFYGLTVIVLSAVLPLWWFKKKGWV